MQGLLNQLLITVNDVWGRVLPGSIFLFNLFLLYHRIEPEKTDWLYGSVLAPFFHEATSLFIVLVLLLSFIVGHVPLFVMYSLVFKGSSRTTRFAFLNRLLLRGRTVRPSIPTTLQSIDPTGKVTDFYQSFFQKDLSEVNSGKVFTLIKSYFQLHRPGIYAFFQRIEAQANLRMGVVLPLVLSSFTATLYGQPDWVIACLLLAALFFRLAVRTQARECEDALRLFYHFAKDESSGGTKVDATLLSALLKQVETPVAND